MSSCNSNCTCISVIISIILGVILGVLYSLGFVSTGIIFWAFLAVGVGAILLTPIYTLNESNNGERKCLYYYIKWIVGASIGTIILAAAGLIIPTTSIVVTSIVIGLATFFVVLLVAQIICLLKCLFRY